MLNLYYNYCRRHRHGELHVLVCAMRCSHCTWCVLCVVAAVLGVCYTFWPLYLVCAMRCSHCTWCVLCVVATVLGVAVHVRHNTIKDSSDFRSPQQLQTLVLCLVLYFIGILRKLHVRWENVQNQPVLYRWLHVLPVR